VRGSVKLGRKTKELVPALAPGEIAVIAHEDLDELAAAGLVEARVRAVINTRRSITGRYPNKGPSLLAEAGIPIVDGAGDALFDVLRDGDVVEIDGGRILRNGEAVGEGEILTKEAIEERHEQAKKNIVQEIERFVENTLEYARREKGLVLGQVRFPELETELAGRPALVVVRGQSYKEDLAAIGSYIEETHPVLIGVDGGADALLEAGFDPDIVVGDMDSVSDAALFAAKERVVHAYPDGRAPGLARVERLGLSARVVPSFGTSEDVALLMAYELGASLIVAVGTHSNIVDFLEKGRAGMASTFLVRLKVGSILIDAKGLSRVYKGRPRGRYPALVVLAALMPTLLVALLSKPVGEWTRMLVLYLRLALGF